MIKIVGQDQTKVKRVSCSNCGAMLEYVPNDIKSFIRTDYTGSKDMYTYIKCPTCSELVTV